MKCGLLGGKLGHSYSPQIHSYLADYSYDLFEKSSQELGSFLKNGGFTGLNVTMPHKKAVIPFCAELSERAKKLGAVNTIVRRADGSLVGHNSDYFGFCSMLEQSGLKVADKKVLVLGSGGASATVKAVLDELGAKAIVISRSGAYNYQNLHLHADTSVIVNATPVGMYPNVGVCPVDISQFPRLEGVLDVIYNPARTQLLLDAERRGLVTMNGLWMLVAQAKESAEWFSACEISNDVIAAIHRKLRTQMENTILIGMPGCGKSTIGKLVAEKLGKKFVDADEMIVRYAGKTIPQIFTDSGEEGFRKIETKVLADLGKESGLVIATGGGCVTRKENYNLLHQNGTIYWLQRDVTDLPTDGRPLSLSGNLLEMYKIREPLYRQFADYIIDNNSDANAAAAVIAEKEVI